MSKWRVNVLQDMELNCWQKSNNFKHSVLDICLRERRNNLICKIIPLHIAPRGGFGGTSE